MNTVQAQARRIFLLNLASATAAAALPATSLAQNASPAERQFAPQPGNWRTFEVTTRVDIPKTQNATRVWLPVPSVNTDWQQSLESAYVTNGKARMTDDEKYGARILYVEFAEGEAKPYVELTSRVKTHNRAVDWNKKQPAAEDPATLAYWTRPTQMLPTDGIVRKTALAAIKGATTDVEKAHRLYDWIVANTFREPKVQGCGEGDIKTMLETGNLGGKCGAWEVEVDGGEDEASGDDVDGVAGVDAEVGAEGVGAAGEVVDAGEGGGEAEDDADVAGGGEQWFLQADEGAQGRGEREAADVDVGAVGGEEHAVAGGGAGVLAEQRLPGEHEGAAGGLLGLDRGVEGVALGGGGE